MSHARRLDPIRSSVERYYTGRLAEHGPTHWGADWNSRESQELRFEQLLRVVDDEHECSLIDYGSGYGALADYVANRLNTSIDYVGFDISEAMTEAAQGLPGRRSNVSFTSNEDALEPADYVLASGVFNVKLETSHSEWEAYVDHTVARMAALGRRGFAFNMLTAYSDAEFMREDLYYGDPLRYFDRMKRHYSRHVALLHDYGLYEFTIVVRQETRA